MGKVFEPHAAEEKWYRHWLDQNYFHAKDASDRPPFSIVIPPPNVTGMLHMGHALNNTLQDIMIRYRRMQGYNAMWMPGTDHAGIATQNVVEQELAREGKNRHDLGREKFIERVWEWKHKYGGVITNQLKRIGCSCDWPRERFTMDEGLSRAVREAFVRLYNDGLIYQGDYIVNWCPRCHTAISDLEVEYKEEPGHLWHIRYPYADGSGDIVVATTRPETMLGDTAVAVNPQDTRYTDKVGKEVILPLVNKKIPVIADDYVTMDFGSGAVKITPACDPADFAIAQRHPIGLVMIMDGSAVMNENCGVYQGQDRYECRKNVIADLEKGGYLLETESYTHNVGKCYRCKTDIEPYVSKQWFVKVKPLAKAATAAVIKGKTRIIPSMWEATYFDWMDNIRDWCISRQIWWGHRIPVWYCDNCSGMIVSTEDPTSCPTCKNTGLRQEEDVLDTWFSSALWPFSTLGWPDQTPTLKTFYPTSLLITGFDILFFWVARMMMMGIYIMKDVPFKDVYLHALVRDEHGDKMSKSKGNAVPADEIIQRYGADTARTFVLFVGPPDQDAEWSDEGVAGVFRFLSRVWRLATGRGEGYEPRWRQLVGGDLTDAQMAIRRKTHQTIAKVTEDIDRMHFNTAVSAIMELTNELTPFAESMTTDADRAVYSEAVEHLVMLLSPFAPHMCDELWERMGHEPSLFSHPWPEADMAIAAEDQVEIAVQVNGKVRTRMMIAAGADMDEVAARAQADEQVARHLEGKTIRKVITVPDKLVNIVAN
ncbi:MAG TPA: valine--tRNA ligase [Armatimonadetes bacterium]|nr:valine--tRNA ligase [Armatimonadota bacterium]